MSGGGSLFMISKKTLITIAKVLKWSKIIAKFAAIGTTITGGIAALTSASSSTGLALTAAGATTYVAAKNIPVHDYEKTRHVSPRASQKNGKSASRKYSMAGEAAATPQRHPVKTTEYIARQSVLVLPEMERIDVDEELLLKKGY